MTLNTQIIPEPSACGDCDIVTVRVGALRWVPHTLLGLNEVGTSDQVDGYLAADHCWDSWPDVDYRSLDIWATDAPGTQDLRDDVPGVVDAALTAWAAGSVHVLDCGFALAVPGETLSAELIAEAIGRFVP